MSDELEPAGDVQPLTTPPTNRRILVIMAVLSLVGLVLGGVWVSARFGIGIFLGCMLAFANYFWMRRSLGKIFAAAREGEKPRFLGAGYFVRYLVLAAVVAVVYALDILPIGALLIGMAGFGFAILVEGSFRIVTGLSK